MLFSSSPSPQIQSVGQRGIGSKQVTTCVWDLPGDKVPTLRGCAQRSLVPPPGQELERLEVERVEMIRQHLCQYTQLRHETDMFNQSVSSRLRPAGPRGQGLARPGRAPCHAAGYVVTAHGSALKMSRGQVLGPAGDLSGWTCRWSWVPM